MWRSSCACAGLASSLAPICSSALHRWIVSCGRHITHFHGSHHEGTFMAPYSCSRRHLSQLNPRPLCPMLRKCCGGRATYFSTSGCFSRRAGCRRIYLPNAGHDSGGDLLIVQGQSRRRSDATRRRHEARHRGRALVVQLLRSLRTDGMPITSRQVSGTLRLSLALPAHQQSKIKLPKP